MKKTMMLRPDHGKDVISNGPVALADSPESTSSLLHEAHNDCAHVFIIVVICISHLDVVLGVGVVSFCRQMGSSVSVCSVYTIRQIVLHGL